MLMKRTVIITLLLCSFFHVAALAVTSHTSIATSTAGFYVVEGMGRSEVWLNGQRLTEHTGGYLPVIVDVTDRLRTDGDNVLTVRADHCAPY